MDLSLSLNLRQHIALGGLILAGSGLFYLYKPDRRVVLWLWLWLGLVSAAFVAADPRLVAGLACGFGIYLGAKRRPASSVVAYLALLPALPAHLSFGIPGPLDVRYIFDLSWPRLLALVLLLPALVMVLVRRASGGGLGLRSMDLWVAAYAGLHGLLALRSPSFTEALRQAFLFGLDVVLPYFVLSRALTTIQDIQRALLGLLYSACIVGSVGVFESLKGWRLYAGLAQWLDLKSAGYDIYLFRSDLLRGAASFGQPLALGFFLVVALAAASYLGEAFRVRPFARRLVSGVLLAALVLTVSRGPWLGFAVYVLCHFLFQAGRVRRMLRVPLVALVLLSPVALWSGSFQRLLTAVPFFGGSHFANIEFRLDLAESSYQVIRRHPWIGTVELAQSSSLQHLVRGSQLDVVNTYLGVALTDGLPALAVYLCVLGTALWALRGSMRARLTTANRETVLLARTLAALLLAIAFMLGGVSSITFIPYYLWSLLAMCRALAGLGAPAPASVQAVGPSLSRTRLELAW